MRVRVELRRDQGVFIPRYRPHNGYKGDLRLRHEDVGGRHIYVLCLYPHETQFTVRVAPFGEEEHYEQLHRMELFEARITSVNDNELRFLGYEPTKTKAWVVQEWDVELLKF